MSEELTMLRFKLTHTGTSGGEVLSSGILLNDDQIALQQRYGIHSDGASLMTYVSVYDMISKIGNLGSCTIKFIDPGQEA
jgi:hypothetical protein